MSFGYIGGNSVFIENFFGHVTCHFAWNPSRTPATNLYFEQGALKSSLKNTSCEDLNNEQL